MSEVIGNQKISPGRVQQLNQQSHEANFIRNQIINSDDEGQNSRRIFSEMGTVQLTSYQPREDRNLASSQYIHTDDENDNHPKAQTAKHNKKESDHRRLPNND